MNSEQLEPSSSPASALALSNIKEGMGYNAERAQELQEELAQQRASLHHDFMEAQALQGKEAFWLISLRRRWLIGLSESPVYLTPAVG